MKEKKRKTNTIFWLGVMFFVIFIGIFWYYLIKPLSCRANGYSNPNSPLNNIFCEKSYIKECTYNSQMNFFKDGIYYGAENVTCKCQYGNSCDYTDIICCGIWSGWN